MARMSRIGVDIMCGIAGFSLSKNSRVNARKLSNALLCGIGCINRGYIVYE